MSLRDPINGPSYKPSPLKPLPWFMRKALNHSVEAQREPSVPNTYLQPAQPSTGPNSGLSTICPSRASTPGQGRSRRCSPAIPDVPLPGNTEVTARGAGVLTRNRPVSPITHHTTSFVREEPLQRPSSRLVGPHRRSDTVSSTTYQAHPEHSQEVLNRLEPSVAIGCGPHRATRRPVPGGEAQSSEYLELYQPSMATELRRKQRFSESPRRPSSPRQTLQRESSERSIGTASKKSFPAVEEREGSIQTTSSQEKGKMKSVGSELKRFFVGR